MKRKKIKNKIIAFSLAAFFGAAFFSAAHAENLKIGFVTDWEYGSKSKYDHKLPSKAVKYLKTAVGYYNNIFHPDLVVGGGDYILGRGVSKKKAAKQMRKINAIFSKANAPLLYCIGNHDLSDLSEEAAGRNLGIGYVHSSTDMNGFRIITMDTNDLAPGVRKYKVVGRVSEKELVWLDEQLNTNLPVLVFSHHSPIQTPQGKNWRTNILIANKVREVLEKYGNVVAVFSGHHAINYSTKVNDINYVIINNLTDSKARGSFAEISAEIGESGDQVSVSVAQHGKIPANYNFFRTLNSELD